MSWYELAPAHHWGSAGMAMTFNEPCYMPGTVQGILQALSSLIFYSMLKGKTKLPQPLIPFGKNFNMEGFVFIYLFYNLGKYVWHSYY